MAVPAWSAQHDYVINDGPGATVRADINSALQAIATNNSGATEPSTTYANMWWYDTSTGLIKRRSNANDAWVTLSNGVPVASASGTVDAITADFSPDIALDDKTLVAVVAAGTNTSTTPTFAPDGLTAHTITKDGGSALLAGEIPASGFVMLLEYNLANTRWELLNPSAKPYADTKIANPASGARGDILYHNGTSYARLAKGTSGYYLKIGANDPEWAAVSATGYSNVIFEWHSCEYYNDGSGSADSGLVRSSSLTDGSTTSGLYEFVRNNRVNEYNTFFTSKFTKISGISTVTVYAKIWTSTADPSYTSYCKVLIDSNYVEVSRTNSSTPAYATAGTIDVSGLTNGTTYDIVIQIKATAGTYACMNSIVLIGS